MNKLLERLAKRFLCPLNIHIKKNLHGELTEEILYCELCGKYKNYFDKWIYNPY